MARLHLFAEGETEMVFARDVLAPHLVAYGVYLQNRILIAHARKKGRVHRGGGRRFLPMHNDIRRHLSHDRGNDVYFTTMIDLYAIQRDFPGLEESEMLRNRPLERVRRLEESWRNETADHRFIPFIQLHEFEAYLFCDLTKLPEFLSGPGRKVRELQRVADGSNSPEYIDDGQHSAPSKRIIAQFPEYEDRKTSVGPQMAKCIGLPKIRSVCTHFDEWLCRLEQLAN